MQKKEIPIVFTPSHLDDYYHYAERKNAKEYSNTKDNCIIVLTILSVILLLFKQHYESAIALLIIFIALIPVYWLHEWINYTRNKKKGKKKWDDWIQKSIQQGYYKIEYDEEKLTLFSSAGHDEFLWTMIEELFYNENYIYFLYSSHTKDLVFPRQTLGDEAFQDLVALSKTKVFRSTYLDKDNY